MNINRLQLCLVLAAGVFVSCQKSSDTTIDTPMQCNGIRASIDADTKVALSDETTGELTWIAGDAIAFSGKWEGSTKTLKLTTLTTANVAEFLPKEDDCTVFEGMTGAYLGLYPYDENAIFNVDAGTIQGFLPREQAANEIEEGGRIMPLVLVAKSEDRSNMNFYNACSGIRFTVGRKGIYKVVFSGNDSETLTGNFKVTLGSDGSDISVEAVGDGENSIVLDSPDGLVPGNMYYLTFLPTEFNSGFKFDFYSADSTLIVRTCCDISKDVPRGVFGTIKEADDQTSIDKIFGGEDLSIDGTANCYIVSAAGKYKFPLCKGNSSEKIQSAVKAEVLWETRNGNGAVNEGDIVTNVRLNNGYVFFSTPEFKAGNAIIAVKDASDEILWSWHIWNSSPAPSTQKLGDVGFMDRNLGALSIKNAPDCFGLLYQWGRKDPFPGAVASSIGSRATTTNYSTQPITTATAEKGTVEYSISHPVIFILPQEDSQDWIFGNHSQRLWDSSKTIYDPCPVGWRIPGTDVWPESDDVTVYDNGVIFNNMPESWFPSTGFLTYEGGDAGKTARAVNDYAFYHTYAGSAEQVQGMRLILKSPNLKYRNNAPSPKGYGNAVRCVKE